MMFRATDLGTDFHEVRAACRRVPVLMSLTSLVKSGLVVLTRERGCLLEEGACRCGTGFWLKELRGGRRGKLGGLESLRSKSLGQILV